MKFEAITIKDIAKALGLSTSTVSRALRDSYEISADTKALVTEYAEKMNYRPNPIAQSLKGRRSGTIGVLVPEIANTFFSQIINGVESVSYSKGYNVIIAQSLESDERERFHLQYLASRSVDGLIISLSSATKDLSLLEELRQRGMHIVFVDRVVESMQTHKVEADSYAGAYEATVSLIQQGYKNIAAVFGAEGLSITHERKSGFIDALKEHGLAINDKLIRHVSKGGMDIVELKTEMQQLLKNKKKPDAIFSGSDKITTGCLGILRTEKIRIPEDMGLIGFSNTGLSNLMGPALSVIRQPAFEMGELSAKLLLKEIESKRPTTEFEKHKLPAQVILRESTLGKNTIGKES